MNTFENFSLLRKLTSSDDCPDSRIAYRDFCGIKFKHRQVGFSFRTTQFEKELLKGVRRSHRKPKKKAHAINKEDMLKMMKYLLPEDFGKKENFRDRVVDWRESTFLAISYPLILVI